jgi:hypothetical protein
VIAAREEVEATGGLPVRAKRRADFQRVLRQAWEMDGTAEAEKLVRNLAGLKQLLLLKPALTKRKAKAAPSTQHLAQTTKAR